MQSAFIVCRHVRQQSESEVKAHMSEVSPFEEARVRLEFVGDGGAVHLHRRGEHHHVEPLSHLSAEQLLYYQYENPTHEESEGERKKYGSFESGAQC